ncbi:MAG: ATP-binding protein [Ktedonobacteraceae bacterium]
MNGRGPAWWPLHRRRSRRSREAGAALFQGLRVRLTLWYCGVLGTALVLSGVALYVGARLFLLAPVHDDLAGHANGHAQQWLRDSPYHGACPLMGSFYPPDQGGDPPDQSSSTPEIVVCYDQNGNLPPDENTTGLPPAFLDNALAKTVLQQGTSAEGIVDGGDKFGPVYRYALIVRNPSGSGYVGVVLVGERIYAEENTLALLLKLLLGLGGIALLGAGLGGLFLSKRALAPARLAWTNQQRFIADAAHELRTPLTLLRADAEVLLRSRTHLATEDAALLEDIVAEAAHMGRLSNNMLTLARLDSNASHREHEVLNLAEIALASVRRVQALADQAAISMQGEALESVLVIGDPTLLEQAVLALLDNAIKYNRPGGQVTVRVAVKGEQALLEVSDTGIGIAAEHLAHLGERFYRVDKARSREAGGTGLGLSIARSIAVAHDGTLTVASVPEQGTTVSIVLPRPHRTQLDRKEDTAGSVL